MRYVPEKKIKEFVQELTDLKTASKFVSIKNSSIVSQTVVTGMYQINYEEGDEAIVSSAYKGDINKHGVYNLRTPSNNTQQVEVLTTYWSNADQTYYTDTNTMLIVSNRPVTSIVRL